MAKTTFLTNKATAKYPHIVSPDTEGQYATNKYTTKFVMTPGDAEPLIKQLKEAAKEHKLGAKAYLPFKKETIKQGDKEVETGNIQFSASSKFAPAIFDAKNNVIKRNKVGEDFYIGSGSVIKIAGEFYNYDKGISLQMRQVQVLELVNTQASMFEASEDGNFDGSEYEDSDGGSSFGEDAEADGLAI